MTILSVKGQVLDLLSDTSPSLRSMSCLAMGNSSVNCPSDVCDTPFVPREPTKHDRYQIIVGALATSSVLKLIHNVVIVIQAGFVLCQGYIAFPLETVYFLVLRGLTTHPV